MSDWRPTARQEILQQRATLLAAIRAFFAERGVMEVETPLLSAHGAVDPNLDSFVTRYTGPGVPSGRLLYLQTSPEFAMKRLLAAGSGAIYQVCKAFRNGESGRWHNPEFTLLEWYRPGFDLPALMTEVDAFLQTVLNTVPASYVTYAELFKEYLNIDAHTADATTLAYCASVRGVPAPAGLGEEVDAWHALLWTHVIEPQLSRGEERPLFVYDYPVSQAMLARVRLGETPVAERFEVFIKGVELANGFHELGDSGEQRGRFEVNNRQRSEHRLETMSLDERFLAALAQGMPQSSGVAVGVDRLLMLQCDMPCIADVLAFPVDKA